MADDVDLTTERQEAIDRANLRFSRANAYTLRGSANCTKCGTRNDRAREGYATCSACYEGLAEESGAPK